MKKLVGLIGWRGMVGSVLFQRMKEENDFNYFNTIFFSTSKIGEKSPIVENNSCEILNNAYDIDLLMSLDVILTCQGSHYTKKIYPKLKKLKWKGYWIDASSVLRMLDETVIVLDPINRSNINNALSNGITTFSGGNCTVSLMLMAIGGLFKENLIDWISVSTYQAASGAGSKFMLELISQMGVLFNSVKHKLKKNSQSILEIERIISKTIDNDLIFPSNYFKVPLATSLIPWIDIKMNNGQTKEEWKGQAETNKILNNNSKKIIPIDGNCVRISSLRCHSQSFTIKMKQDIHVNDIKEILKKDNSWISIVPNHPEETIKKLTPISVSGSLKISVGRIRKLNIGSKFLSIFSVGDQLLWGAAEPLRRMLRILVS